MLKQGEVQGVTSEKLFPFSPNPWRPLSGQRWAVTPKQKPAKSAESTTASLSYFTPGAEQHLHNLAAVTPSVLQ